MKNLVIFMSGFLMAESLFGLAGEIETSIDPLGLFLVSLVVLSVGIFNKV